MELVAFPPAMHDGCSRCTEPHLSLCVCVSAAGSPTCCAAKLPAVDGFTSSKKPDARRRLYTIAQRIKLQHVRLFCLTGHHTSLAISWKDAAVMLQESSHSGLAGPADWSTRSVACNCLRVLHWPNLTHTSPLPGRHLSHYCFRVSTDVGFWLATS